MTKIITPPDIVADETHSIMLVAISQETLGLVVAALRNLDVDVNVYLCRREEDVEWFRQAANTSQRIFRGSDFEEIHDYLMSINV